MTALWIMGLCTGGIGVLVLLGALMTLPSYFRAANWQIAQGEIISAESAYAPDAARGIGKIRVDVRYRYTVEGTEYESNTRFNADHEMNHQVAPYMSAVNPYRAGQAIDVLINPANPQQAILERRLHPDSLAQLIGALGVFALAGLFMLLPIGDVDGFLPIVGGVLVATGFVLFYRAIPPLVAYFRSANWQTTQGELVGKSLQTRTSSSGGMSMRNFDIVYRYTLNDVEYMNNAIFAGSRPSIWEVLFFAGELDALEAGDSIDLLYAPDAPHKSAIKRILPIKAGMLLGLGVLLNLIGILILLA